MLTSCASIRYAEKPGVFYHDFGPIAHYYSDTARDFGIELYHGDDFFSGEAPAHRADLPSVVRKTLAKSDVPVLFILRQRLQPHIVAVHEVSRGRTPHNGKNAVVGRRKSQAFYADTLFEHWGKTYWLRAFSLRHPFIKSKSADEPSANNARSALSVLLSGWKDEDFVRALPRPDNFLLGEASAAFKQSNNNYLFTLEHIHRRRAAVLAAGDSADYFEAASTFESFVGNYKTARLLRDSLEDVFDRSRATSAPFQILGDARRIIYDSARRHSVVVVNEAHTQPLHRRFASSLLDTLHALGYRHLFVETLVPDDSEMTARGFPVQESGYYSGEPHFGAMLRKAMRLGFTLHPYDNDSSGVEREIKQAEVIADFIKKHPAEKLLVHCGHGHGNENTADSMMGTFLRRLSGVNSFTIEQTRLTEHGDTLHEHPAYRELVRIGKLDNGPSRCASFPKKMRRCRAMTCE